MGLPGRFLPRPACRSFRDEIRKVIFPEMSVQATAVADAVERDWARSFSTNNASSMLLRSMALAQGSLNAARCQFGL